MQTDHGLSARHCDRVLALSRSAPAAPALRFNVNGDFNREPPKIEIDSSLPSLRVIRALDELVELRGIPRRLRLDNGPEFISAALKQSPSTSTSE